METLVEKLRETENFVAERSPRGVRISVRVAGAYPRSRVVRAATFEAMRTMSDSSFDGTAVLELGIGVFSRR